MRRIFISDPPSQRSSYCRCPNLQQASLSKTELVYSSTHNTTLQHTCRCYISTVNNSYIQTNSRKLLCTVSRITSWEFLQCIYLLPDVYSSRRTVYFFQITRLISLCIYIVIFCRDHRWRTWQENVQSYADWFERTACSSQRRPPWCQNVYFCWEITKNIILEIVNHTASV